MTSDSGVSVVIAAYNAKAFVRRAIDSALMQTLAPLEVLVVDDCSTDGTQAEIEAARCADDRVRILSLPRNSGPSAARNHGIDAARGRWVAVLDADDAFAPERLASLVSFADRTGADIVADDVAYYDAAADMVTGTGLGWISDISLPVSLQQFLANNLADGQGFDWGLLKPMFRRSALVDGRLHYDTSVRHGEDFQLMVDLLLSGARFSILKQPLYLYTQREGALSGRASGMTRTTIDYHTLKSATLELSRDPRLSHDREIVELLHRRAKGLGFLDDSHFVSTALRSAAFGKIVMRTARDPAFLPFMLRQIGRAVRRRLVAGWMLFRRLLGGRPANREDRTLPMTHSGLALLKNHSP